MTGADFSNAVFDDVNLGDSTIRSANLSGAKLNQGSFYQSNLISVNLNKATFGDFSLFGITSSSGISGTPKNLPTGWRITAGQLVNQL